MHGWKKRMGLLCIMAVVCMLLAAAPASAAEPVDIFTPYTSLAASPGQTVTYSLEARNNTDSIKTLKLAVEGLPADWSYELKAGTYVIREISVKNDHWEMMTLAVDVPLAVEVGAYRFSVTTDQGAVLPLTINILEKGTYTTTYTTDQPSLEGSSTSTFTYTTQLSNKTAEAQTYALRHGAERGWDVRFKSGGKDVSSIVVEPNAVQYITVDVTPALDAIAGNYAIPLEAASGSTGATLDLEAVVAGSYGLELTTPSGLLSAEITSGGSKTIELEIKNTGTSDLTDIQLTSTAPVDWDVTFGSREIRELKAGQSTVVSATINSSSKSIAGDYVTAITARSPEAQASASFRVAVKTSVLWGWLGIALIAAVFGGIYYLFRKYGRR